MRAVHEAKDALIRAAARLTGLSVDQARLAEAFTELAGAVAWLTRIPGSHAIAYDFARMLVSKLGEVKATARDVNEVRRDLDLETQPKQQCPHCGKDLR